MGPRQVTKEVNVRSDGKSAESVCLKAHCQSPSGDLIVVLTNIDAYGPRCFFCSTAFDRIFGGVEIVRRLEMGRHRLRSFALEFWKMV